MRLYTDLQDFLPSFFNISQKCSQTLICEGVICQTFDHGGGGAVITSAPMRALSSTWLTVRIEAARICVSKP